jgi:hypothetical protein
MSILKQLYFKIVEENNYMFRPFSGWAIIRLRLEYRRKLVYCNVDIKNGGTISCFLQQFENTVVLRRTFIHLISTSIESHNGDDAGWCGMMRDDVGWCRMMQDDAGWCRMMPPKHCIYQNARWDFSLKFGAEIYGCLKFTNKQTNH